MAGLGKSTTKLIWVGDELTIGMRRSAIYKKAQAQISGGSRLEIISLKELRARI